MSDRGQVAGPHLGFIGLSIVIILIVVLLSGFGVIDGSEDQPGFEEWCYAQGGELWHVQAGFQTETVCLFPNGTHVKSYEYEVTGNGTP